jgi:hypothetical protein
MKWGHFAFLGWISLGAVAAGAGFSLVIQEAKQERLALQNQIASLKQQVTVYETEQDRVLDHAQQQAEAAAQVVARAQQTVEEARAQQLTLAQAQPLTAPTGRWYTTWEEALSLPLGVSLRVPPGTRTYADDRGLVAMHANQATSTLPWLSISTYHADQEQVLKNTLTGTEDVSYLISGNLVSGVRGKRNDQSTGYTYVLRVVSPQTNQPTHLIWAQTEREITENRIRETLATLALRS